MPTYRHITVPAYRTTFLEVPEPHAEQLAGVVGGFPLQRFVGEFKAEGNYNIDQHRHAYFQVGTGDKCISVDGKIALPVAYRSRSASTRTSELDTLDRISRVFGEHHGPVSHRIQRPGFRSDMGSHLTTMHTRGTTVPVLQIVSYQHYPAGSLARLAALVQTKGMLSVWESVKAGPVSSIDVPVELTFEDFSGGGGQGHHGSVFVDESRADVVAATLDGLGYAVSRVTV
jgi:hypothetical protein